MILSEISIRRPVFAWMLMAALIVFGLISFNRLGISQLPDVDFPVVSVSLSLQGAAPVVMESQVIDLVEDTIMQIEGIRSIRSTSSMSSGSVSVEFELGRDIDQAVQDVQNRIAQIQNQLPKDLKPPTVRKSNPEDQPILWIAVTGDQTVTLMDMMMYARDTLFDQFSSIPGVGDISLGGYVDPALRVWVDLDKLNHYNFTSDDVLTAITNEHKEVPAGRLENKNREYNLRLMGEASTPEEFSKILIESRGGQGPNYRPTPLGAIAKVEEGTVDVRRRSRFNQQLAVGLGIQKRHGANAVEVAEAVRKRVAEIQPILPKQYHVEVRSDSTRFIKQSVHSLIFTLILSAILTSLVCFLFLGSWSSTINVLFAIPTSLIGSFIFLHFFGFTLNTFTLLGLALAIGIVVDDAIMMLENIVRHREMGKKRKQAAIDGSKEITFAAVAATIAVVAIFIPVVFMKGVIGRYFFQYGITVTAAVLLSLLEALTLTPMRCAQYLSAGEKQSGFSHWVDEKFNGLARWYQRALDYVLSHRVKTLLIAAVVFALGFAIAIKLPSEMMPPQDQSQIMLRFKGPPDASLDYTDQRIKKAETYLRSLPEVDGVFATVGGFGGDAVNQAQVFVSLVDRSKRKLSQSQLTNQIREYLSKNIKGIRANAQDMSLKGFAPTRGFPVEFIIQGPDWDKLVELSEKLTDELESTGVLVDVNTDIQKQVQEIHVIPDRDALSKYAVSMNTVSNALNALVGGALLNGQTEYPKNGHRYEIEVRLLAPQRTKAEQLNLIQVRNNRGEAVPLRKLVKLVDEDALQSITRLNRARSISIYANPAPGHAQQEALKVAEGVAKKILPQGYYYKMTGSSQSFKESFEGLIMALLLGILVSYMVLASQFNSFIHPVVVLLALPFSFTGAFAALALCHQSINIYSMIGFILLMGIVKKNSILLVDFTNHLRSQGSDVKRALLDACPVRLRPIIMTSLATVAGALPEALAIGPGSETTIPMSIAIIGGVIASTVLTLFVVPCAYSLLAKFEKPDELSHS
jgi:HAE1 family hydrophobic/amphiphilic exporter-1